VLFVRAKINNCTQVLDLSPLGANLKLLSGEAEQACGDADGD
jgi:hypothetical protein